MLDGFPFEDGQATGARRGQNVQDPVFTNGSRARLQFDGQLHSYIIDRKYRNTVTSPPPKGDGFSAHGSITAPP